jgi:hypothetical protein
MTNYIPFVIDVGLFLVMVFIEMYIFATAISVIIPVQKKYKDAKEQYELDTENQAKSNQVSIWSGAVSALFFLFVFALIAFPFVWLTFVGW